MALSKKQERFANKVLVYCGIYIALFSVAQYISFLITQTEQERLIEMTFTVLGVEVGGLLFKRVIEKVFKVKKNDEEDYS